MAIFLQDSNHDVVCRIRKNYIRDAMSVKRYDVLFGVAHFDSVVNNSMHVQPVIIDGRQLCLFE